MNNIELHKIKNLEDLQRAKIHLKYTCEQKENELKIMLKDLPSNLVINLTEKAVQGIINNVFDRGFWKSSFFQSIFQTIKSVVIEKMGLSKD